LAPLQWNPALKTIKLFGGINTMGIVGARHVADSLRYNDFLTALDLSNNELGDDAVMTLTNCLLTNFTLQSLTLFNNKISDIGACELARLLHFNQALNILAIGGVCDCPFESIVACFTGSVVFPFHRMKSAMLAPRHWPKH
jgi:Ran GTPase-activating protein (RanGAP) involved in mRNA processing and transport